MARRQCSAGYADAFELGQDRNVIRLKLEGPLEIFGRAIEVAEFVAGHLGAAHQDRGPRLVVAGVLIGRLECARQGVP